MWVTANLKELRWVTTILAVSNIIVIILGVILALFVYSNCERADAYPFAVILLVSCVRITVMIRTGIAQRATAMAVLSSPAEGPTDDALIRRENRVRYKRWLWWTRFGIIVTVIQFAGATYLLLSVAKHVSVDPISNNCVVGLDSNATKWQHNLLVVFMIMVYCVALVPCCTGSDVLRWRSFYTTEDNAWKAHYREVFDHSIREALCCLGRVKYLTVLEEDEVYSVAQLLGDLVTYRASGTGHLEILAGLALLQRHSQSPKPCDENVEAPEERMHEALVFHPFAEAAYTGLLLDFGRNPVFFPCAWLYRQGILTPWTRKRRPVLEGDNWWRGHAAAFLKYLNLSPETLRKGRVNQAKCQAAYFILVLHHLKSVVIAVRGTETPEDLITDGLCRECILTAQDLDGFINGNHIQPSVRQTVVSSLPHHAHSGIVEAARDLFMQIDGNTDSGQSSEFGGFLSSLLGPGCECYGYNIRIVGHSLGGAISALLGLRLCRRYPKLHVFAYGALPCVDSIVADACSDFVTSIVYHNEFSARLSVASILRLRAAAIMALSQDATTDSTTVFKLARHFLFVNDHLHSKHEEAFPASDFSASMRLSTETMNHHIIRSQHPKGSREQDEEGSLWQGADIESSTVEEECTDLPNSFNNPISQLMEAVRPTENGSCEEFPEMFLPGLVIHVVPQNNHFHKPLWKRWRTLERECHYRAYIANREAFKDIVVSPSMFLDHLPWRCHYAMRKVMENCNRQIPIGSISNGVSANAEVIS